MTAERGYDDLVQEKYDMLKNEYSDKWYPKYWLAYLFYGKPAKLKALTSLSSGGVNLTSNSTTNTDNVAPNLRSVMKKSERRVYDTLKAISPRSGLKIHKIKTPPKIIVHQVKIESREEKIKSHVELLEEEITLIRRFETETNLTIKSRIKLILSIKQKEIKDIYGDHDAVQSFRSSD